MIEILEKPNTGRRRFTDIPGDSYFVPVIDGEELSRIAETWDMAMLIGIGYKYDGPNSQFAKMAARMLGIDSVWAE